MAVCKRTIRRAIRQSQSWAPKQELKQNNDFVLTSFGTRATGKCAVFGNAANGFTIKPEWQVKSRRARLLEKDKRRWLNIGFRILQIVDALMVKKPSLARRFIYLGEKR